MNGILIDLAPTSRDSRTAWVDPAEVAAIEEYVIGSFSPEPSCTIILKSGAKLHAELTSRDDLLALLDPPQRQAPAIPRHRRGR